MEGKIQQLFNKFIWNTRSVNLENPKVRINGYTLDEAMGGGSSSTGRTVSKDGAMTMSAVYRAVAIKSGFISSLPFKVYRKTPSGRVEDTSTISRLLSVALIPR